MNWLIGGAAVLFLGPPLLRALAANPDAVRKSADLIETGRSKAIEYGKRGAQAAYEAGQRALEERRASRQVGTFGGLFR